MSTHEQDRICAVLVEKMRSGQHLNPTEKAHLSQCAGCMREVVLQLDQMAEVPTPLGMRGEPGDAGLPHPNPEVIQALENGRRNFAREFGL